MADRRSLRSNSGSNSAYAVVEGPRHYAPDDEDDLDNDDPTETDVVTPLVSEMSHLADSKNEHNHVGPIHPTSPTYTTEGLHRDSGYYSKQSANIIVPNIAAPSTYLNYEPALNGFFPPHVNRSTSSRRSTRNNGSTPIQSSPGSLRGKPEPEPSDASSIRRASSNKSMHGNSRGRRESHSKSASTPQALSRWPTHGDHPVYPDQSFLALQGQYYPARPKTSLRSRSSHPTSHSIHQDMADSSPSGRDRATQLTGSRTADNTPLSSPGLFSPTFNRSSHSVPIDDLRLASPQLHHLQAPKETHTAEIDHDLISGNKLINTYEVMRELGRGEHGKVKLGRDIENDTYVAIKIVSRYSRTRRLGKLGGPEDQTKREVAVLKKARHPNVVSLLEVIDDPNKNKVYLVLEYVEFGEIKWRKTGVPAIQKINNQRYEAERKGVSLTIEPSEGDRYMVHQARIRHEALERQREKTRSRPSNMNWSLEHGGDTDDEGDVLDISRSLSRQFTPESHGPSRTHSYDDYSSPNEHSFPGSMYSTYDLDVHRLERKFSIVTAISHMSSEMDFDQEDEQASYVPALTQEEARRAFRDTLQGLEFLHYIGIIHRDIKPSNLLVGSHGTVKISDFGVSYLGRPLTEEEAEVKISESEATPLDNEKELARSVGTPAFWAPELCYEDASIFADNDVPKITGALDLWALGITLYCMVYARLPFYANETIGLHEAVCTTEVCCPRTRLVPVDTTDPEFVSRSARPINSNKRLDYELRFETVPDNLRDLIKKLLTKDPSQRITIREAKCHPWVVEGISNVSEWIETPEMEKGKQKILEVDEKEISRAVVKRNLIERALTTAKGIAGSLLGRGTTRKRGLSNTTTASNSSESINSPANSSTSTVGKNDKAKEARRISLRGDEFIQALKTSREGGEHPLAQSQTASPEVREQPSYFPEAATPVQPSSVSAPSDMERRPRAPERAVSAISTADSVKTIRAVNMQQHMFIPEHPKENSSQSSVETSVKTRMEGLWEGTTKNLARLTSRDRRHNSSSRSPRISRASSDTESHAPASLALSTAHAAGAIQTPTILKAKDPFLEPLTSPTMKEEFHTNPVSVPASSDAAFEHAQNINNRRLLQEMQEKAEVAALAAALNDQILPSQCPPSPDDFAMLTRPKSSPPYLTTLSMQSNPSASTIASSADGYGDSSVSQSISNPSFGGISGASSPPGDTFLSAEYKSLPILQSSHLHTADTEPEFMRTADTVTDHGRPKPAVASGKPLERELEYYDDGDDENEDSDEEVMMMGGPSRV